MIHIACAADESYLPHAAAMLHSLRSANVDAEITIHFLTGPELGQDMRSLLMDYSQSLGLQLEYLDVPQEWLTGLPTRGYLSSIVWYRIFLAKLLPQLDRVLFLDCDLIVQTEITSLWNIELGEHLFAAVTNVVEENKGHRAAELGLPGPGDYFNAGIGLWNLAAMRNIQFWDEVTCFAKAHSERLLWLEQDAINSLYWQKRLPIHPRWNFQNGMFYKIWGIQFIDEEELKEATGNPAIIHFEGGGSCKPWHYLCDHPGQKAYLKHRKQTPWPEVKLEGRSIKNWIKKYPLRWLGQINGWIRAHGG